MGKTRSKKHKKRGPNPTGIPSQKEAEEAEEEEVAGENEPIPVAALAEKLQSAAAEDRECALVTIAAVVGQPGVIKALLKDHLRIIGPLVLDACRNVRHVAVGALRNMTVEGGHEVSDRMMELDIMTPLVALLKQYGTQWKPQSAKNDQEAEIFLHAVHLLWNLCESSEVAVNTFNREDILQILLPCLQSDVYGYDLAVAVAQCLHTVTDSNTEASSALNSHESVTTFIKLIQGTEETDSGQHVLLKTLAIGVLFNISNGNLGLMNGNTLTTVMDVLVQTIEFDTEKTLNELGVYMQEIKTNGTSAADGDSSNHIPEVSIGEFNQKTQHLCNILQSQQLVIEILSNLCCANDDGGDEWEDLDSSDDGMDVIASENLEEDMQTDILSPLCIPKEIHSLFASNDIVKKVIQKINSPDQGLLDALNKHSKTKAVGKRLKELQIRAMLCLSNMVSAMEADFLGGLPHLHMIWLDLTQLARTGAAQSDMELLEAVTSAMRAVIVKLGELKSPEFKDVTPHALQMICEMGDKSGNPHVRTNTIRIVSTIGCMLALQQQPHSLLKNIGVFLLEICAKDSELWVIAEALDSIFDVFSEDHLNPVVMEIGLVQKLKQLSPLLKQKIHQQKRFLGEHLPIVTTARTNLIRFIKYKNG
ncbi:HEAT repeat-containing protein 3-like [Lineus longissimus]|uniref:HEAT repeat-containing protein 3-like n=1 Tax=Lineus longissimus TaxID=88925 RepID=UPI002B4F310B